VGAQAARDTFRLSLGADTQQGRPPAWIGWITWIAAGRRPFLHWNMPTGAEGVQDVKVADFRQVAASGQE
jgi:hypothetical protein